MSYDTTCWLWKGILPKELCETIILEGDKLTAQDAKIGSDGPGKLDNSIRKTNVSFLPQFHWLEGICSHYAFLANASAKWNVALTSPQPIQYTRYFPDEHYTPHRDSSITAEPSADGMMRKLSVVLQLTDPSTYTGGDFFIEEQGYGDQLISMPAFKQQGSVLVFPSIVKHAVAPVKTGVRHSAVCWYMGPRYR